MTKLWISAITLVLPFFTLFLGAQAVKDLEKLQGTWSIVSLEHGGKKAPDEELKKLKVAIEESKLVLTGGPKEDAVTFRLDASVKPKLIDFYLKGIEKDDEPDRGIYELDGDMLKICWSKGGGARPTEFASKADSSTNLVVLKREKK